MPVRLTESYLRKIIREELQEMVAGDPYEPYSDMSFPELVNMLASDGYKKAQILDGSTENMKLAEQEFNKNKDTMGIKKALFSAVDNTVKKMMSSMSNPVR